MKKNLLIAVMLLTAAVGFVMAGGVDVGRALWFQHPAIFPATQVLGAGATITADACGGVKRISATAARTTDTTDSFTAPSANNAGCVMDIQNVGPATITIDSNAHFPVPGGVDMVLQSSGSARVFSTGSIWTRTAAWTPY